MDRTKKGEFGPVKPDSLGVEVPGQFYFTEQINIGQQFNGFSVAGSCLGKNGTGGLSFSLLCLVADFKALDNCFGGSGVNAADIRIQEHGRPIRKLQQIAALGNHHGKLQRPGNDGDVGTSRRR